MTTTPSEERRFRPALWPTVIAGLSFLVIIGLGTWQLVRLEFKVATKSFWEAQIALSPVELPFEISNPYDAARHYDHRRASIAGVYMHDRELFLAATRRGTFGFHVITPLRRGDGSTVLIDRGWVPADARDPETRRESQYSGEVTVEGLVRDSDRPGWFVPDNDPYRNYWFWRDVPAMAEAAGVADALPFFVEAGPAPNAGGLPIGREYRLNIANNHLSYAITWFSLAVALAVIYVLSQRRGPHTEEQ